MFGSHLYSGVARVLRCASRNRRSARPPTSLRCSGSRRPGTRCDTSHSARGNRNAPGRPCWCSAGSCTSQSPGLARLTEGSLRKWTWTPENDVWNDYKRCPHPVAPIPSVRTRGCSVVGSGGTGAPGLSGLPGWVSRTPGKRPRYGGNRARKTRVRGLWSSLHLDTCPHRWSSAPIIPLVSTGASAVYPAVAESIFRLTSLHRRQERMIRVKSLCEVSHSTPPSLSEVSPNTPPSLSASSTASRASLSSLISFTAALIGHVPIHKRKSRVLTA